MPAVNITVLIDLCLADEKRADKVSFSRKKRNKTRFGLRSYSSCQMKRTFEYQQEKYQFSEGKRTKDTKIFVVNFWEKHFNIEYHDVLH